MPYRRRLQTKMETCSWELCGNLLTMWCAISPITLEIEGSYLLKLHEWTHTNTFHNQIYSKAWIAIEIIIYYYHNFVDMNFISNLIILLRFLWYYRYYHSLYILYHITLYYIIYLFFINNPVDEHKIFNYYFV